MAGLPIIHGNPTDFEDNTVLRIMLWLAYLRRHDSSHIMTAERLISIVKNDISFFWMLNYAGFEIIAGGSDRNPAKELIHVDVTSEPGIFLFIQCRFHISILTVRKTCHKQMYFRDLTGISVDNLHSRTAPINLTGLSGFMLQMI